jgi:hypothetical protein
MMAKIRTDDLPVGETLGPDEMREIRGGTTTSSALSEEEVRKQREQVASDFKSFDQKSSQLYNLMSGVLKNINEMGAAMIRNLL